MAQQHAHKTILQTAIADDEIAKAFIAKLLGRPAFDHGMGVVIMLNMVIIIVETDHSATHEEGLPWAGAVGWAILIIFIVELILRLFLLRRSFFSDGWNTFDFLVVVIDSVFSILGLILGAVFPISVLRILRLCKLARVSKVFRVFPELRILMAGLIGSFKAIFWGTVLLAFVLLVWAIIAVQFIHPLNIKIDHGGCDRCPRAYSSVLQATLTFSQQIVAGDSWGQATIPVIEAYPLTALYFMGVFLSIGIAVMNLILGVVVNVAMSEHDRLSKEIDDERNMARLNASDNILKICMEMDGDGSGELTKEELLGGWDAREDFRDALTALDVEKEDLDIAFTGMDPDKSGTVSYEEFCKQVYKLKGSDSGFLLEQLKYNMLIIKDLIVNQITTTTAEISRLQIQQTDDLGRIEDEIAVLVDEQEGKEVKHQHHVVSIQKEEGSVAKEPQELKYELPGGHLQNKEILDTLLQVSSHLRGEFTDTLKNIDSSLLELHRENTSKSLSLMTPPVPATGEVVILPPTIRNAGMAPGAMCCRA